MNDTKFRLGAIDFGFVGEPPTALQQVVEAAIMCERLGYERFWLGEHHGPCIAYTSPMVLAANIAARTRTLRIGIAGVLLRYYAPYRVVEEFVDLERMFPGRIEAGVARGIAHDAVTRRLITPGEALGDSFDAKLDELLALVDTTCSPGAPVPPIWLLGSSTTSAKRAASSKLHYAVSHFLTNDAAVQEALEGFAAAGGSPGDVVIAVAGVCARTRNAAESIAGEFVHRSVARFKTAVVGTPEDWLRFMHRMRERTGVTSFAIQPLCIDSGSRDETFALLAQVNRS